MPVVAIPALIQNFTNNRKRKLLSPAEMSKYRAILVALAETLRVMVQIDALHEF